MHLARCAVALLALAGAMGAGHAQEIAAPDAQQADPAFETAFAPFDIEQPVEPAIPDHAVDITTIEPAEPEATSLGTGVASYYGRRFHGRPTASGQPFDMHDYTAAHRSLPFGSHVRVTNTANGRSVVVRINDRGPFVRGRTIDLSRVAAEKIGIIAAGHGRVELELLDS